MGHGKRLGQLVEGFTTHRAVWILGGAVLLVALTEKIGQLRANRSECQCYTWILILESVSRTIQRLKASPVVNTTWSQKCTLTC